MRIIDLRRKSVVSQFEFDSSKKTKAALLRLLLTISRFQGLVIAVSETYCLAADSKPRELGTSVI